MSAARESTQRFRVSPGGVINLAAKDRQALGFREGSGRLLDISVEGKAVRISPTEKPGPNNVKASPKGLFKLTSEAHMALTGGKKGYYSLARQDQKQGQQAVYLQPA